MVGRRVVLPRRFLYPLLTADQFDDADAPPRRWVLLPHDPAYGQPLTAEQVAACPGVGGIPEPLPAAAGKSSRPMAAAMDRSRPLVGTARRRTVLLRPVPGDLVGVRGNAIHCRE